MRNWMLLFFSANSGFSYNQKQINLTMFANGAQLDEQEATHNFKYDFIVMSKEMEI